MLLQALLVTTDDPTAETLIQVLAQLGVAVGRSNAAEVAVSRLTEESFDQVIVDFDEPEAASLLLDACRQLAGPDRKTPVTVALLRDASQIRSALGASGAHFVLIKPIVPEQAENTLRAATSLLKRERRRTLRIAVQAAVSIRNSEGASLEGILLDLSTGGLDVLAAKPLAAGSKVSLSFMLPEGGPGIEADAEVAWSNRNGQTGLRFLDIDPTMREGMNEWLTSRSQDALPEEQDAASPCTLTDLSLGGCYVQTSSPFPQSSTVDLCLRASGMEIHAEGLVRVMHPGHGMGVEFPARTDAQRANVAEFIEFLTSQPHATPQLEVSPRALTAGASELNPENPNASDNDDPLLELLRTGSALDEDTFLDELHRQRTPANVN
jgi:CheY-like chemotaxis protein